MSQKQPTFSVIIPNYNNGATLGRAIESVLAQTYPAKEIILIDDGSSDDSAVVAATFGNRIRYVRQQNAGVSAARNYGARLASAEWLTFLDADDVYLPERLAAHARWIAREPDVDFLFADQEYQRPDGKLLRRAIDSSASGRSLLAQHPDRTEIPITQADFEQFIADGFAEIRTLSVPRATFLKLGGFPFDHRIGEDLYFFIRLCAVSRKGGVINVPLAIYYIYPESVLRKDPLGAQRAYVATLESLAAELRTAPHGLRRGWRAKVRHGRLSLAYMYLRMGCKSEALAAVTPLLLRNPSFESLRDVVSIIRGMP
ncbi:Glycosyltransferase involved in cell wall bisynthesis [Noviherbaspirillum humi]|uniref:Glycosyltransferase involved in cell wall bisynthesis n=1 Tax=Noviherbaspirillum humi TaxID=1688639 RepID=A0A239HK44_9BURK|nr:glycosyltransferase [Noviherbaspirillum humi]SNS81720.1 Glycosyltransferase involved in cell wall bisynthesis [Noviherbaspirillum humi]